MRPKPFRPGDLVKIINPQVFLRVGYPLTIQIARETLITNEERKKVLELLNRPDVLLEHLNDNSLDPLGPSRTRTYDKIIDALAYLKVAENDFGGREKKIYTEERLELKDQSFCILSKRVVVTGVYNSGGGGYDYNGEYEYEPAYLSNSKANILLKLPCLVDSPINDYSAWPEFEIEAKNVELVHE